MSRVRRLPMLLVALGCACQDFSFDPIDPPGPPPVQVAVTETFVQAPLPALDLLFVIDGSESMDQELQALASDVPLLIETLAGFGLDWQIGVVGADLSGPHPGWLLGAPYVLTPSDPDPGLQFAERLPIDAPTDEAGLAAAIRALELSVPGGANAGFRRDGAGLHVVFVSDDDDASGAWLGAPVEEFLDALAAASTAERPGRASALVGDIPDGCTSNRGAAQPGDRYHEVVAATGGRAGSICAIDFLALLQDLAADSVALPVRFPLTDAPVPGTLRLTVDGVSTPAWAYDTLEPAVVFDEAPPADAVIVASYVVREASVAAP